MNSPEVTIVLPVFNRLQYLRPAVDSILAQSFRDWELIVADDGSQGETATYLAALANPPRIRVLHLPHSGNPGAVRNAALRVASGEYIAFLDSDDLWLPEKLTVQIAALRSQPQRGWSHTAFAVIDESGALLTGKQARSWPASQGWVLEQLIRMDTVIAIASVVAKRALLEELGGFDPRLPPCEDYDLWLRLAAVSELDGVRDILLHKRAQRAPYYDQAIVLENLGHALEKLMATDTARPLQPLLRSESAKLAAALARSQVISGHRWAALRTLAQSPPYSWGYREWWLGGVEAVARAVTPTGVLRVARAVVRRNPPR
jgi:glycosyltransferase involved in cell wall biosynthesis